MQFAAGASTFVLRLRPPRATVGPWSTAATFAADCFAPASLPLALNVTATAALNVTVSPAAITGYQTTLVTALVAVSGRPVQDAYVDFTARGRGCPKPVSTENKPTNRAGHNSKQ